METPFRISTADGKEIFGYHHTASDSIGAVLILVHGLTGSMNQYLHITAARWLEKFGVNVIRFSQYHDDGAARRFHQTTISMHVADTRVVIKHAQSLGYKKIFLAGHSLGGPVAIAAACHMPHNTIAGLLLWDPTFTPSTRIEKWENRDAGGGPAFLELSFRVILGDEWIVDAKHFPNSYEQLESLNIPLCVVAAENGGLIEASELYRKAARGICEFYTIRGSTHSFPEVNASEMVAEITRAFIRTHLKSG